MQARTQRQKEIYDYIVSFIDRQGYEPSYQQIARYCNVSSKATIAKHISALEKQGLISRRNEDGSFNLVIRKHENVADLVCGIEWFEDAFPNADSKKEQTEPLYVPRISLGNFQAEWVFAFRIFDDSMIGEHICHDDIALLEKRTYARDGDCVVVAMEGGEVLLRRFYRVGGDVELRSANEDVPSVTYSAEEVHVKGVFRGLIRPLS